VFKIQQKFKWTHTRNVAEKRKKNVGGNEKEKKLADLEDKKKNGIIN